MAPAPPDPIYTFRKNMGHINCLLLDVQKDKELLYIGTGQGRVHIWDLKTNREITSIRVSEDACLSLIKLSDSRFMIQEKGGCLKCWKVENMVWQEENTLQTDHHGFCRIIVDGGFLFSPSDDGIINVFDTSDEQFKKVPVQCCANAKRGEVMSIKYLRKLCGILAAYEDGTVTFWSYKSTVYEIESELTFRDIPMCIDFSEITNEGLLGTSGDILNKFSLQDNNLSETCSATITNPGVSAVAISSDGKLCILGCWDGRIRYFSMKHLKLLAVLDHHTEGNVQCLLISDHTIRTYQPGTVFAGGSNGRVSLWDLYTNISNRS